MAWTDPFTSNLLDLLSELRDTPLPLIVGGGFGLYLKRLFLEQTGQKTLFSESSDTWFSRVKPAAQCAIGWSLGALALSFGLVSLMAADAFACSSCGCSFNSDWASEGYTNNSGFRLDTRFDYLVQDQLRQGSRSVSRGSFELPNDNEIQQETITREYLVGADYSASNDWGVHVLLPILDRTHSTIAPGDANISSSATSGVGDAQIVARYQGFSPLANLGVQLGLKLPTGRFTDTFSAGPQTGGLVDRGLQNGTGTTDAIVGLYKFGVLTDEAEYFVHLIGNQPLAEREGFRPGTSITASSGIDYHVFHWLAPQMQINYRFEAREEGENSDRENSGGNFVYLTPGASFRAVHNLDLYVLVQIPIYQRVNGLQLEPRIVSSFGARVSF